MNYAQISKKKYLFYILIHPVTGFEELKYNRKGSLLYANTYALCLHWRILSVQSFRPFFFVPGKLKM